MYCTLCSFVSLNHHINNKQTNKSEPCVHLVHLLHQAHVELGGRLRLEEEEEGAEAPAVGHHGDHRQVLVLVGGVGLVVWGVQWWVWVTIQLAGRGLHPSRQTGVYRERRCDVCTYTPACRP